MLATDRAHFSRCNPYMDSPQSIGKFQVQSYPFVDTMSSTTVLLTLIYTSCAQSGQSTFRRVFCWRNTRFLFLVLCTANPDNLLCLNVWNKSILFNHWIACLKLMFRGDMQQSWRLKAVTVQCAVCPFQCRHSVSLVMCFLFGMKVCFVISYRLPSNNQCTTYGKLKQLYLYSHWPVWARCWWTLICVLQHAYALELLHDHLYEGAKALDVGSGSGILSVCFARMVSHFTSEGIHGIA